VIILQFGRADLHDLYAVISAVDTAGRRSESIWRRTLSRSPVHSLLSATDTTGLALLRWLVVSGRETDPMGARRVISVFAGFRFPPEVISIAVRWYLR
jgi:hypothetical protein